MSWSLSRIDFRRRRVKLDALAWTRARALIGAYVHNDEEINSDSRCLGGQYILGLVVSIMIQRLVVRPCLSKVAVWIFLAGFA